MEITDIPVEGYERVARCKDEASGLHALIAVHDTTLGPALGGMRLWDYESEEEALFDVVRLAKGMTFKSAVADTGLGGGKSVILGDPDTIKTPELFRAMGRFIQDFGGKYITAEDMNIRIADLRNVRETTASASKGRWRTRGGRQDRCASAPGSASPTHRSSPMSTQPAIPGSNRPTSRPPWEPASPASCRSARRSS